LLFVCKQNGSTLLPLGGLEVLETNRQRAKEVIGERQKQREGA